MVANFGTRTPADLAKIQPSPSHSNPGFRFKSMSFKKHFRSSPEPSDIKAKWPVVFKPECGGIPLNSRHAPDVSIVITMSSFL